MRYITETRNLFDINSYSNLNNNSNITINGNSILCVARAVNAYVSYRVHTVIGEKYTVSNKSVVRGGSVNTGNFCLFLSDNSQIDNSNYLAYGLQSGQSFTLTATSEFLYIHWYVCYNFDSNNPSTIEINELQVELGDTATPYVPYGYLPMRRMKYKVSNVCQLLDKSKYPATQTINGVTFTNNGDGSYAVSGRSTGDFSYLNLINSFKLKKNHIYLNAERNNVSYCYVETIFIDANRESHWVNRYKADSNSTVRVGLIRLGSAEDIVTLFPQFFDLTEMYGAGNEPTTIEQFHQDFPEEMYDYSPYCWASMKNIRYIDTTKNLFDIRKVTETDTLKVIGNSIYSYSYPAWIEDASTLSIFKSLKPNTNYTISAVCSSYLDRATNVIAVIFNNSDGIWVFENYKSGFGQKTFSLTQEQIDNIKSVYFYGLPEEEGGPTIWSNIQIEEGDTATNYVPYGYLPLK